MIETVGISGIGQIAIAVAEVNRAKKFYADVLELDFLFDAGPELAFFQAGDTRLMITTLQGEERDHRTSAIYYKVDDIELASKRLTQRGANFVQEPQLVAKMPDHELWMGFLRDPDENLVGIMAEQALT